MGTRCGGIGTARPLIKLILDILWGLTQHQVSRYERGVVPVPMEVQAKISLAVGILKEQKVMEVEDRWMMIV